MKVARPVLRGEWPGDGLLLPDYAKAEARSNPVTSKQVKWFCQTCRTVGGVL